MTRTRTPLCLIALACLPCCGKESSPAPAPKPATTTSTASGAQLLTHTVELPPANPLADTPAPAPQTPTEPTTLIAHSVNITVPASWIQETPSNSMRAAQYRVPAPQGSGLADGELVLFRGIQGSTADNLARWERQVTDPIGERRRATNSANGITVDSLVQFGTYDAGMAMAASGPQPDWGFAGAIITGDPQGVIHLKLLGPRPVIEAELAHWDAMLQSILTNAPAGTP